MENITKDNLKHQNVYTRLYPSRIWFKLLPTSSQCAALYTTEYPLINHSCAQHNEPKNVTGINQWAIQKFTGNFL